MTIAFALVPAIFCFVGALLLLFGFRITKEKVVEYQKPRSTPENKSDSHPRGSRAPGNVHKII
jgi:energy-converting hydrogenase Eha subunit F